MPEKCFKVAFHGFYDRFLVELSMGQKHLVLIQNKVHLYRTKLLGTFRQNKNVYKRIFLVLKRWPKMVAFIWILVPYTVNGVVNTLRSPHVQHFAAQWVYWNFFAGRHWFGGKSDNKRISRRMISSEVFAPKNRQYDKAMNCASGVL